MKVWRDLWIDWQLICNWGTKNQQQQQTACLCWQINTNKTGLRCYYKFAAYATNIRLKNVKCICRYLEVSGNINSRSCVCKSVLACTWTAVFCVFFLLRIVHKSTCTLQRLTVTYSRTLQRLTVTCSSQRLTVTCSSQRLTVRAEVNCRCLFPSLLTLVKHISIR